MLAGRFFVLAGAFLRLVYCNAAGRGKKKGREGERELLIHCWREVTGCDSPGGGGEEEEEGEARRGEEAVTIVWLIKVRLLTSSCDGKVELAGMRSVFIGVLVIGLTVVVKDEIEVVDEATKVLLARVLTVAVTALLAAVTWGNELDVKFNELRVSLVFDEGKVDTGSGVIESRVRS